MEQYLQEPTSAAVIAAAVTVGYVFIRSKMNGEQKIKNSEYFKPAFLVGLLVYFIVSQGQGSHGQATKEPF
jgi:uncharacterized membrane protein YphA (DoxX/SURF4 family)